MSIKILISSILGIKTANMKYFERIVADPRHFQILTLSSLLMLLILWSDFAPELHIMTMIVVAALGTQYLCFKCFNIPSNDYRSPLITSLSLALLFKTNLIWLYPLMAVVAIASKFFVRANNKHIFNPANAAIVVGLILLPDNVWVSPGQWGNAIWLGFALISFAALVLSRAGRADMALFFLGSWAFLLFARAIWLGDPLEIPLHNLQSGALLIFAFFMISDPMTTPNHRIGRFIFAFSVACLAYILQYEFQVGEAIFYALFAVCLTTPIIDYFLKDGFYQWRRT